MRYVALDGAQKAWDVGGPESLAWRDLHDLAHRASTLISGVEELERLSDLKGGALKRARDLQHLQYQHGEVLLA